MPAERRAVALQRALGRRVRALRQARGWSQERLGEAADLHWTYVGRVERGKANATLHALGALARGLGVTVSELTAGIEGQR